MSVLSKSEDTCKEVSKSQWVRLADVFLIAPFLGYVAYSCKGLSQVQRTALYGIAVATLVYNGRNFILTQKENA